VPRPTPTLILHFTHVSHLASIASNGLSSDSEAQRDGVLAVEVGSRSVKDQRRTRVVPVGRGGFVADYVPFYFAPRSPMMFAIDKGQVPEYTGGIDPLVYLVSTVERLVELGTELIVTDGNATTGFTRFSADLADLDELVDWAIMKEKYWRNTPEDGDRRRRRMAECLAVGPVPWEAFGAVVARSEERSQEAAAQLATIGITADISVRPDWYF
jgi:hypothetical protein